MADKASILIFVADINSYIRIESASHTLGYKINQIESAEELGPPDSQDYGRQLAEPIYGRTGTLIEIVSKMRPSLIIFDLNNPAILWEEWITILTSVPATRRIPVLCYGSHVDTSSFKRAKEAGATRVVPRSKFFNNLPELIGDLSLQDKAAQLEEGCSEQISSKAVQGLEEFNRGDYFEAHESLESAWMADSTEARELYRAVLQVAVAYYQILRGNYNGALKMFLRNRQWIEPLPDKCRGIDVARLREDARLVHSTLVNLGPDRISEFDRQLLRPVRYQV